MQKEIIVIKEGVIASFLKDLVTFGSMITLYYLNHRFCGGSCVIDIAVSMFVFIWVVGKSAKEIEKKKMPLKDAIEYLNKMQKSEQRGECSN